MCCYLKNACNISDIQGSCCKLHNVSPSCLYLCHKVGKILSWWSALVIVWWNNDFSFVEFLSTYGVIELMSNLWRCRRNPKEKKVSLVFRCHLANNMKTASGFVKWDKRANMSGKELMPFQFTTLYIHMLPWSNQCQKKVKGIYPAEEFPH